MKSFDLGMDSVEDVLHGVVVRDPYRRLEDSAAPETREWIRNQQTLCEDYFAQCEDVTPIRERVRTYLDHELVDQPAKVGDRYFFRRRSPGRERACLYVRDGIGDTERLLVDPSDWGPFVSVGIHRISREGSLLAYEVRHGGEDRVGIRFVDVESGQTLQDQIETGLARGLIFLPDSSGFVYCHLASHHEEHTIRLHLFDSPKEVVLFRTSRSRDSRLSLIADDERLGALHLYRKDEQLVASFFIASRKEPWTWKLIAADKPLPYGPALKDGHIFALTFEGTSDGKLVELNDSGDELSAIVPEQEASIRQLVIGGGHIFASYLHNLVPSLQWWSLSGGAHGEIRLPGDGTIRLLSNPGFIESNLFYTYESFDEPIAIFEYRPDEERSRMWHKPQIARTAPSFKRHIFYPSKDGTQIPMTLVEADGRARYEPGPVLMTGYGGFGIPMTPQFSVLISIMLELGAVFALPQIRGGSEFGQAWHHAAKGHRRQTAFDDFLAAGEWLCTAQETSPDQLAIFGGSNSGLLVAAAMTQRPDLFRAVLCIAPLLDMVRYERFDESGKWRSEFGTVDLADDFDALYAYSPYHRIEEHTDYPAVLFVSGDKDDRCNPAHVRKTAARLQNRIAQTHPILVDYSVERGHAPMLPLSVRIEGLTRRIAFFCRELGIRFPREEDSDETASD
jgi:prolyl oligopeptidase